ncbi:hypothetical protein NC651_007467 [Populus alba x Populus x berolinensis]|nr:hypothetical protein NC651_007467 [Populus alba x Populus x berolinensis]
MKKIVGLIIILSSFCGKDTCFAFQRHDISWYDGDGSEASLLCVISSFALEFDKEKNHALSYTKVLPVPLTTPDFSMPTMSSESLARCLHCILDRCSVRYEDEWERRKGFLTVKVTLSWIVFVVCSLDYGP